jgi:hypothetical protein
VLRSPRHKTSSRCKLKAGAQASDRIKTAANGQLSFVGRGSSSTGRGGHLLIADDLIKDAEEADSPTMREKIWNWFVKVFLTRQMRAGSCVVLVMTRWNEDDVVGRLTDPHNPAYNKDEASKWKVLNLPAIAELSDPMGRKPGEALWPERFPLPMLEAQKHRPFRLHGAVSAAALTGGRRVFPRRLVEKLHRCESATGRGNADIRRERSRHRHRPQKARCELHDYRGCLS